MVTGVVIVGFVVLVVSSTRKAAVPVGASGTPGSMPGMSMPTRARDRVALTVRDIDGRPIRIPNGRAGIAVFVEARGCDQCVEAVRAAARAVRRPSPPAALLVVNVDSTTGREDMAAFARAAGRPAARYVVDDRNGSVASAFTASVLASTVVFDARGRVAARPDPSAGSLARALRRAGN